MIIPALPAIQHDSAPRRERRPGCSPPSCSPRASPRRSLGRLGDMYGKEKVLLAVLGVFALGSFVCAIGGSIGVLILGRAIQGAGGAIFPLAFGIIRDEFPRERVATSIGADLRDLRHRRRARPRSAGVMVDHLSVQWIFWSSVVVTAVAAGRPGATSPSRRCGWRRGSTGAGPRCCRSRWPRCCSASRRATRGAGARRACSGCSPRPPSSARVSSPSSAACAEPMVDMQLMSQRPVWSTNLDGVRDRLRDVRLLRADPPARELPAVTGYGFGKTTTVAGSSCCPARCDARRRAAVGLAGIALRLAPAAGARRRVRRLAGLLRLALSTRRWPRSPSAACSSASASASPSRRWPTSSLRRCGRTRPASPRRSTRSCARSAARSARRSPRRSSPATAILGGRFPAESGFTAAFAMSAVAAAVALIATSIIPRPRRRAEAPTAEPEPERELRRAAAPRAARGQSLMATTPCPATSAGSPSW